MNNNSNWAIGTAYSPSEGQDQYCQNYKNPIASKRSLNQALQLLDFMNIDDLKELNSSVQAYINRLRFMQQTNTNHTSNY